VRLPSQQDHVVTLRLAQDRLVRYPHVGELSARHARRGTALSKAVQAILNAKAGPLHQTRVPLLLQRAASDGYRLRPPNARLVDDPQANQQGIESAGPLNAQVDRTITACETIQPDENAPQHVFAHSCFRRDDREGEGGRR